MTVRSIAILAACLAAPLAARAQMPAEGTTIPVLEGNEPSLSPPASPDPTQVAVAGVDPAAPFLEALSPYGAWIAMEGFGLVWQPDERIVGAGYTPYVTSGHWEMTNAGWQFASDQAFGWAVYHYGRWLYDDQYGWVWAPGTEWGASWVDWQTADNYVGWAPLPPAGYAYPAGYGPSYVFVSLAYMASYDLWSYLITGAGVRRYVDMATPCGFGWYGSRSWPYGPGLSMFASAGVPVRGVVIPVPPSGHVYRGSVEVSASPAWGSVPVRTPGGTVSAGSVAVHEPMPGSVAVNAPGGRGAVAVGAPPPAWTSTGMPRWGTSPRFAPIAPAVAPRYSGELPGIHSTVSLHTPTNVAPRFVPQATNYARPPVAPPSYYNRAAMAAPAVAPMGAASWRAPSYAPSPSFGANNGGFAARPSFNGGYGGGVAVSPSYGGGYAGGGFAARPSFNGGGGGVAVSPGGGGGFAGGGGFHAAPSFAPSRPVAAPAVAPSFGGGGGFGGFAGGGFRGGGVSVRTR